MISLPRAEIGGTAVDARLQTPSPRDYDANISDISTTVITLAAMHIPAEAQTTCGPRVRRNWDALSDSEKETYKGALASVMDSGAYIKFVKIHQETMSTNEAHASACSSIATATFSGQLASLYTGCDGSATPTSTPIAATNAPAPTTNAPQPITRVPTSTTATPEPLATNAPEPRTDAPAPVPTTASPLVTANPSLTTAPPSTNLPTNNQQMEDARRFFEWLWNSLFPNTRSFRELAAEGDADAATQQENPATPTPLKGT
ncbi:unnamed protein product [Phytophthora lilii]|uniref:Unnamed protein product n=1 Tax=Phytophthora lilii TaxID=2077276 RepID=A0A9W7CIC8_9STRA|nr:unnamed protein product [Phytophthora lilii]